jgi:outer membrane immunogenic protein
MTRLLLGSVALLASIGGAAHAADLAIVGPAVPAIIAPPTWDGLYGGFNIGGRWINDNITTNSSGLGGVVFSSPGTLNAQGVMGGLQAGYNWQLGNVVVGIEADANVLTGASSRNVGSIGLTDSIKSPEFLATVRPRVGWAFDHRLMVYGTAGYAFETAQVVDTSNFGPVVGGPGAAFAVALQQSNVNARQSGWTAGAGLEYAFSRGISAKVEYLYVGLGSVNSTILPPPGFSPSANITVTHNLSDNIIRAGMNFHLGY